LGDYLCYLGPYLLNKKNCLRRGGIASYLAFCFLLGHLGVANAFLPHDDGSGGSGIGEGDPVAKCLENTATRINATPAVIEPRVSATLSWSIRPPAGCNLFNRVIVDGKNHGLIGSLMVWPSVTTDYPLTLILPSGSKTLGPVRVTVNIPIVAFSPGSQITAQDIPSSKRAG
jgi:hypothetical protein